MKIIVVGNGFIASHLSYEKIQEKLIDESSIREIIKKYKPNIIINTVGFTGRPNIDQCEMEKEKAVFANTIIPCILANICKEYNIHCIMIGSGCIFFGRSPHAINRLMPAPDGTFFDEYDNIARKPTWIDTGWKETDFANPQSYYSKTKYACDLALGQMPNVATLRIRMPISSKNTERNFINKIRNYKQIIDIPNSVTFMDDLVRAIDWFIQNQKTGIYHVANPQPLSAAKVMQEYKKYVPNHTFEIITEQQLDTITTAKRSNCLLNTDKLTSEGFYMTDSFQALENCMSKYIKGL